MKGWPRRLARAAVALLGAAALFFAASWIFIDWSDAGSDAYPGGRIVVDAAGEVLRVSLGAEDEVPKFVVR